MKRDISYFCHPGMDAGKTTQRRTPLISAILAWISGGYHQAVPLLSLSSRHESWDPAAKDGKFLKPLPSIKEDPSK